MQKHTPLKTQIIVYIHRFILHKSTFLYHCASSELESARKKGGRIYCPCFPLRCQSMPFSDRDLAAFVGGGVFVVYQSVKRKLMEAKVRARWKDAVTACVCDDVISIGCSVFLPSDV